MLYYSFIHAYIHNGNIAWEVPIEQTLKNAYAAKTVIDIIHLNDRFAHARNAF